MEKEKMATEELDEEISVVTLTAPDGTETEFAEDIIILYKGKQFAALVQIPSSADDDSEPDIILARMETDENGEISYVSPTDEEFEAVAEIYENM